MSAESFTSTTVLLDTADARESSSLPDFSSRESSDESSSFETFSDELEDELLELKDEGVPEPGEGGAVLGVLGSRVGLSTGGGSFPPPSSLSSAVLIFLAEPLEVAVGFFFFAIS